MKLLSLVLATFAATAVQAGTMQWCQLPGQGCYMLKRAADASNEVRRSASAVAEAVADAFPGTSQWCHLPGQGCAKAKRAAEAAEEVKRSADAFADAMAAFEAE
ncbi:mating alpha-pheromone PpgA [Aspergillus thermomutatus]|uniref:Mating alpha-pheromone PpgA n=1 Tax=Aspergillus thermomutatus TaxID=41047 RepID=A0A397HHR9_ASPTH|nr:uncharacterized protein CDV56_108915 [Aspergillus thermomutatus]RHZ62685.1 hypothetical protein CDV56_108915 [Aspergillus thermomutatus]